MAETPSDLGAGAVSLGHMVVIHEAEHLDEARRIAARLEEAGIPALVQSDVGGLPNLPALPTGAAWIAVPSLMAPQARDILTKGKVGFIAKLKVPRQQALRQDLFGPDPARFVPPAEAPAPDPGERLAPVESALPDSGPLMPRVLAAAAAVGVGTLVQRLLTGQLGREVVMSSLGASTMHADEWWRLITAGFMHFTAAHHLSNAAFGLVIGVVLFGTHRIGATAAAWLVASAAGMSAEMAASAGGALIAGASAGNYGLVGLWARGQIQRAEAAVLPQRERLRTLGVIVLLVPGALTPLSASGARVAVVAHAAGFVAGFVMGGVFRRRILSEGDTAIDRRSKIGLVLASLAVTVALAFAGPELAQAARTFGDG